MIYLGEIISSRKRINYTVVNLSHTYRKVPVLVPTNDLDAERFQVTLAMIISKLLG